MGTASAWRDSLLELVLTYLRRLPMAAAIDSGRPDCLFLPQHAAALLCGTGWEVNVRVFERSDETLTSVTGVIKLPHDTGPLTWDNVRDMLLTVSHGAGSSLREANQLALFHMSQEQLDSDTLDPLALRPVLDTTNVPAGKHFIAAVFRKAMIGLTSRKYRHRLTSCAAEAAAPAMRGGSYWPCCVHCLETLFGARWNECLCSALLLHARPYFRLT